jgi:hypothetical protein
MRYLILSFAMQGVVLFLNAQSNYFDTKLEFGTYPVGFKTLLTYDLSRPAVAEQNSSEKGGRFMQVNVWYPAKKIVASAMNFREYINLLSLQTEKNVYNSFSSAEKQFFTNTAELKGDTILLRKHFIALAHSKTKAFKNAPTAEGAFPLVIFSDFASNQSIICEYLASHGYIVLSTPLKGTYKAGFDYSIAGVESGIADLQFALSVVRKEFRVKQSFTVMGLGIGATVALGLQMRNPDVCGVISLEGGITTGFEFNLIRQSPYFNNERIDKPILVIHAPHPDVKPELTDAYKYADRWLINFPQNSEFYFLNFGIWEATMKGIIGKAPGDTKTSFEAASVYVLHFLNTVSKKDKFLPLNFDRSIAAATYKQAVPIPPSVKELIASIENEGVVPSENLYKRRKEKDPEPVPFTSFYQVAEHLIVQRDFSNAADWTALFKEAFPSSAIPWVMSGRCQLELNNKAIAKEYYEKALSLLPGDDTLSQGEKDYYRPVIEKRIETLKG